MFHTLKKEKYAQVIFQKLKQKQKTIKTNKSIKGSKQRKKRLELSCSKNVSALRKGITSKHDVEFYCLNYLHSFRTENKLKSHEKACKKSKDFCGFVMRSEKDNILEFNQCMKLD